MIKRALKGKDHPFKEVIHKKHNTVKKALHTKNPIVEMWKGKDWGEVGHKKSSKKKNWFLA